MSVATLVLGLASSNSETSRGDELRQTVRGLDHRLQSIDAARLIREAGRAPPAASGLRFKHAAGPIDDRHDIG